MILRFSYVEGGVMVHFPTSLDWHRRYRLTFEYTCQPAKASIFVGWDDSSDRAKQIWTQGQGINHRHWIPSFDDQNDKLITSVRVSFRQSIQ